MNGPPRAATVWIVVFVDVVGALAADSLHGNVYMFASNSSRPSTGQGTEHLTTRVAEGDQICWTCHAPVDETLVSIVGVEIDSRLQEALSLLDLTRGPGYPCWLGVVSRPLAGDVPYRLSLRLGSRAEPMTLTASLAGEEVHLGGTLES